MRRGVGIQGLDRQKLAQSKFKKEGQQLEKVRKEQMGEQLVTFKVNLEEFAKKHKKNINKNPEFRKKFVDMCTKVGVDPLASNKGFWAELLGVGSFYYELGIQITDVCLRTRSRNGGLIELSELTDYLIKIRGSKAQKISEDDIEKAVKKLHGLGGFTLLKVGSVKMVQSVPCELNNDHTTVLLMAQEKHYVTEESLKKELQWDIGRIKTVLELLEKEGMAWIDEQTEDQQIWYWFPSLIAGSLLEMDQS